MNVARIIEIIEQYRRTGDKWGDEFESGAVHGANDAIDDILLAIDEELKADMAELVENMPK